MKTWLILTIFIILLIPISPVSGQNNQTFTITKIEQDLPQRTVFIQFTDKVNIYELQKNLRLVPPVHLYWYNSTVTDQNVLILRGAFKPGQRYNLFIPEGFKSINGRPYTKGVSSFTMPDIKPEIAFLSEGSTVELRSRQLLHLQIVNVDEILLNSITIPPCLIPAVINYQISPSQNLPELKQEIARAAQEINEYLQKDSDFRILADTPREQSQLFFTQREKNIYQQFSIPMTFREEKEKGSFIFITLNSNRKDQPASSPSKLIQITDMGITYKLSNNSLLIWLTSLNSGRPLQDVTVFGFTDNEIIKLGRTDAKGLLIVKGDISYRWIPLKYKNSGIEKERRFELNKIRYVVAINDTDRAYTGIIPAGNIKPSNIKQQNTAEKYLKKGTIFTERGIYRPGERVYFKGVVRQYRDGVITPPAGEQVLFTIRNSKDEEIYRKNLTLSEFGTANDSFLIKSFFPLGTYTITMKFGPQDTDTVNHTFQVQEFRQPRHYVEIECKMESKKDESYINLDIKKDILNCEIRGVYYTGGPVKHGKVRWSLYHTKTEYNRDDYPGYTFGFPLESKIELLESGESILDEKGRITLSMPLSKEVLSGKYGVEIVASVVDFDGRASSQSTVYQIEPDYLVGISEHPDTVNIGEPQTLYAIAIDKKGSRIMSGKLTVQVMREGWTYIQKRNEEGLLYDEEQRIWRKEISADLPIEKGVATFDFDFSQGGKYLIAFIYRAPDGKEYTSATFYSIPWYYEHEREKKAYEPLSMYADKSLYLPKETIKVYLNPHRPVSNCLWTIEQQDIIEQGVIDLKSQRYIEFKAKEIYNPNIYISMLCTTQRSSFPIYSVQADTDAPNFLFGTVNVEVKGEQQKINISINEETKKLTALPGSEMTLTITTTDQAGKGIESELVVAVVDESILAMTGFKTPSLEDLGRFLLPLGVFTGDTRLSLLKQTPFGLLKNAPLTGGDWSEAGPQAAESKIRKDFNPVAYFNPSLLTDSNGRATVTFKFPDTMTTYRVYVVACDKGSRFGSYQRSALVVKDFYLEPGLPAFFTKGDRFKFFVSAFNKTDKTAPVEFNVNGDTLLTLSSQSNAYPLEAFSRTLIPVEGQALSPGTSTIRFSGRFMKNTDTVELKIPVNSGFVLGTEMLFGDFRKETTVNFRLPQALTKVKFENMGPDEFKVILTVSGSPIVRLSGALRYLLRYPYGCVEQTSSGVLPLAALREMIKRNQVPGITIEETDKFLKPGIERLFSMQTASGGFGYWPGDNFPHKWGTIYALTAITRAKLAGFDVPEDRLLKALNYLRDQIKASGRDEYGFRGFGVYILALNKVLDRETFNRAYESIDNQPREAAILVLMAARLAKFELSVKPESPASKILSMAKELVGLPTDDTIKAKMKILLEKPWSVYGYDEFYARYREPAISLLAATMEFPKEEITHKIAARLTGGINNQGIWTSTSDTGWALLALSEYLKDNKQDTIPSHITIKQMNKIVDSFILNPGGYKIIELNAIDFFKNPSFYISSDNNQTILYQLQVTFPRIDYAEKGYSNGLEIHKTIRNTDGSNVIKVGDIVEVRLRINVKKSASYLVIDDPLPAGFVAINSAIKTEEHIMGNLRRSYLTEEGEEVGGEFGEGIVWSDIYWNPSGYYEFSPSFFEIRKDRVLAFKNRVWNGIYEYSYYARAVTEGEFIMPSTKIQLMYEPDVVGYTPMGKIVIKGKE